MCVAVVIMFGLVLCGDLYSKSEAVASIFTILAISILLSEEQQEIVVTQIQGSCVPTPRLITVEEAVIPSIQIIDSHLFYLMNAHFILELLNKQDRQ